MHQQSVILHRYGYNHTAVKSCRLNRWSSLVLINQLFRSVRCTRCMHNFGNIVDRRWYWSINSSVPSVAHAVCTILATLPFSTSFIVNSARVYQACKQSSLQTVQRWENVFSTAKTTIPWFGMNGFLYHHSLYTVLCSIVWRVLYTITRYIWFCIPLYTWLCIPSLVIYGCVYHHSLYMVLYTIVYMVLYTITRYKWFCIPLYTWFCIPSLVIYGFVYHWIHGFVYHHSLYMVLYTIVCMVLYTITRFTWFCIPVLYTIIVVIKCSFSISMLIRPHVNMRVQKKRTYTPRAIDTSYCKYKGASRRAALAARRFTRRLHATSSAVVVVAI